VLISIHFGHPNTRRTSLPERHLSASNAYVWHRPRKPFTESVHGRRATLCDRSTKKSCFKCERATLPRPSFNRASQAVLIRSIWRVQFGVTPRSLTRSVAEDQGSEVFATPSSVRTFALCFFQASSPCGVWCLVSCQRQTDAFFDPPSYMWPQIKNYKTRLGETKLLRRGGLGPPSGCKTPKYGRGVTVRAYVFRKSYYMARWRHAKFQKPYIMDFAIAGSLKYKKYNYRNHNIWFL